MNINLTIEQLIIDGFDLSHHHRPLLQAALEAELGRLLAEGGVAPSLATGGAIPHLSAGPMNLSQDSDPTSLGQQIAQTVYRGLNP